MANSNNQTTNNNTIAASVGGAPNKKKVISVNAEGQEINTQTGQVLNTAAGEVKQSGGGPEGPATQNSVPTGPLKDSRGNEQNLSETPGKAEPGDGGVQGQQQQQQFPHGSIDGAKTISNNDPQAPQSVNPDDIDLEKFISGSETEVKTIDEKQQARIDKAAYLSKALDSRFRYERLVFNNVETGEFIGTKFRYLEDDDGKSIYDYMNDPVVNEHITFIVDENDPKDGSPVNKAISFFWHKPTF